MRLIFFSNTNFVQRLLFLDIKLYADFFRGFTIKQARNMLYLIFSLHFLYFSKRGFILTSADEGQCQKAHSSNLHCEDFSKALQVLKTGEN